jgi:hypothetical protein
MVKDSSLAYPIKKSELAETRIKVASSVEIHDVWVVVRGYKDTLLADLKGDHSAKNVCSTSVEHQLNHDSRTIVDRLGAALTSKLQEAHRIMMDTCTKEPPPSAPRFKRAENKKFQALLSQSKALKHFLRATRTRNTPGACRDIHATPSEGVKVEPSNNAPSACELAHEKLKIVLERMANMKLERSRR